MMNPNFLYFQPPVTSPTSPKLEGFEKIKTPEIKLTKIKIPDNCVVPSAEVREVWKVSGFQKMK